MFGDKKDTQQNIKDTQKDTFSVSVRDKRGPFLSSSYPKLSKLITGLYMVTDIMDKEEPLRLKLRTLGVETLSDIHLVQSNYNGQVESLIHQKIQTILSFLDIALSIGLVSEMNFNILKKEFIELSQLLQSSQEKSKEANPMWLKEFLLRPPKTAKENKNLRIASPFAGRENISHAPNMSKKQRRDDIVEVIKQNGGNATITDIKNKASMLPTGPAGELNSLATCGEKTLQRELVSMLKDGVLNKTGEKRWSKYFLP